MIYLFHFKRLILRHTRILKIPFLCYSDFPSPYGSIDLKNNNKLSDNPSAGFDFQKMKTKDDAILTNLSDSIEVRMSTGRSMILCMNNIIILLLLSYLKIVTFHFRSPHQNFKEKRVLLHGWFPIVIPQVEENHMCSNYKNISKLTFMEIA